MHKLLLIGVRSDNFSLNMFLSNLCMSERGAWMFVVCDEKTTATLMLIKNLK